MDMHTYINVITDTDTDTTTTTTTTTTTIITTNNNTHDNAITDNTMYILAAQVVRTQAGKARANATHDEREPRGGPRKGFEHRST